MLNDWYDIGIPERIVKVRSVLRCKCSKLGSPARSLRVSDTPRTPLGTQTPSQPSPLISLHILGLWFSCWKNRGCFFVNFSCRVSLELWRMLYFWDSNNHYCAEKKFVATVAPRLDYTLRLAHIALSPSALIKCVQTKPASYDLKKNIDKKLEHCYVRIS